MNILEHFEELDSKIKYKISEWGITASELATQLKDAWKQKLSDEVWSVQNCTAKTVVFKLKDPWTAAFVDPTSSRDIFYNIHTLGRGADHKHIIDHEEWHLIDANVTGNPYCVSWLDELSDSAKRMFEKKIGISLSNDRFWVEGFNELRTINRTGIDDDCGYLAGEVPGARKMNNFVQEKSGVSPIGCYLRMTRESMNVTLRRAILTTGNVLLMEEIATEKAGFLWPKQKDRILRIAKYTANQGISLWDKSHAWSAIVEDGNDVALAA